MGNRQRTAATPNINVSGVEFQILCERYEPTCKDDPKPDNVIHFAAQELLVGLPF
jgi:hypothetical protein